MKRITRRHFAMILLATFVALCFISIAFLGKILENLEKFFPKTTKEYKPKIENFNFKIATITENNQIKRDRGSGKRFKLQLDNETHLEMVEIPKGTFFMGSPDTETSNLASEKPQNQLQIKQFYMGRYPITQLQWEAVAKLPEAQGLLKLKPATFISNIDLPIETVSWEEAEKFCEILSAKFGGKYRLPSEAEWEYACRGEANDGQAPSQFTKPFHFGATINPELANYDVNYNYGQGEKGKETEYKGETTAVGSYQAPNNFGLEDMHGNVWEWCQDTWHNSYQGAPLDGTAWIDETGQNTRLRVIRGGAWHSFPHRCRSASRESKPQTFRSNSIGFRVVWTPN